MSNQLEKNVAENMPYGLLISATYNSQKKAAVLKFYEPTSQRIFLWVDKSGHKPYCYSKLSPDEISCLQKMLNINLLFQIQLR